MKKHTAALCALTLVWGMTSAEGAADYGNILTTPGNAAGGAPSKATNSMSERTSDVVRARARPPMVVATRKSEEDTLFRTLTLPSNPAHAGGFSGFSGMRQLRHTKSLVSINTVSTDSKVSIAEQADRPQIFLGEISVSHRGARRKSAHLRHRGVRHKSANLKNKGVRGT